jgi:hypothetical protein
MTHAPVAAAFIMTCWATTAIVFASRNYASPGEMPASIRRACGAHELITLGALSSAKDVRVEIEVQIRLRASQSIYHPRQRREATRLRRNARRGLRS